MSFAEKKKMSRTRSGCIKQNKPDSKSEILHVFSHVESRIQKERRQPKSSRVTRGGPGGRGEKGG